MRTPLGEAEEKYFRVISRLAEHVAELPDEEILSDAEAAGREDTDRDRVQKLLLNAVESTDSLWGSALPVDLWLEDVEPHDSPAEIIVYCDFDGVLNRRGTPLLPIEWCHSHRNTPGLGLHYGLEPELVARVDALLRDTGAKLVLSTSWVNLYGMNGCLAILRHFGFRGEVFGVTPRKMSSGRSQEIWWDIEERRPKRWVILNDAGDGHTDVERSTRRWIRDHLVLTDPEVGLTDENVARARELLWSPARA